MKVYHYAALVLTAVALCYATQSIVKHVIINEVYSSQVEMINEYLPPIGEVIDHRAYVESPFYKLKIRTLTKRSQHITPDDKLTDGLIVFSLLGVALLLSRASRRGQAENC